MLNYTDSGGNKPAVIFLHFFGGSALSWTPAISLLQSSFRCIAVDLPGFGNSKFLKKCLSAADHAASVILLAESLDIKTFLLAGHSMGGKIAMALAAASAENVRGLILAAPSPLSPEPFSRGERIKLRHAFGDSDAVRKMLSRASGQPLPPKIFEQAVADNLRTSDDAWQNWVDRGSRENISGLAKRITCPAIILAGEKDKKLPATFLVKKVAGKLKFATVKEIESAGHLIPLEKPQEIARAVKKLNSEGTR